MNQEMQTFIETTEKVQMQMVELIASEQEKRQALLSHDMEKIEDLLQAQQAMVMKLDGMEKRRFAAQAAAGFDGKTVSQILEIANEDTKKVLSPIFEMLRDSAERLRYWNQAALDIAGGELEIMERSMRVSAESGYGVYQSNGKRGNNHQAEATFEENI